MTARQPRTPQDAAMLDPMGLLSFPSPNIPRGLFGAAARQARPSAMRNSTAGASLPPQYTGTATPSPMVANPSAPPPIDQAPPPPANWKNALGPDLMAQLPMTPNADYSLPVQQVPPAPPMRGGMSPSGPSRPPGMFGASVRSPSLGEAVMSDKIGNRGAPLPMDANGNGKKGFDWRMVAGIVGDALLGLNGQQPLYAMTRIKENQAQADHRRRLAEQQQEWQYRNSQPDYATIGNRRFSFNPATGKHQTLYVAPSEAEDYAAAHGFEPGTDEYARAMQDYVLRQSGPTATDNSLLEEDNRQENRMGLETYRQGNRVNLENVRHGNRARLYGLPTYRDTHPRAGGASGRGVKIIPGETVIVGQGGVKRVVRGGKWVDAQ